MHVHVLFHDRCFDGISSAAMFTRFYKQCIDPSATFSYRGLTHGSGTSWSPEIFTDAPVHACVDFRYSPDERLTWWFDHHQSGFETPEDRATFDARQSPKHFWDPKAKSCTMFLARIAAEKFGFDTGPVAAHLEWAEVIDGALFPDARTAVALEAPALQLMLLAEATTSPALLEAVIRDLAVRTLDEVVASAPVQQALAPVMARHRETVATVRSRAKLVGRVATFDVADDGIDNFNKFIVYDQFPEALYTVAVSRGSKRSKVSVGSNPWRQSERTHDISRLCERFGGGGHPAVGAASFPPEELARARQVAAEIAAELQLG